MEGRGLILELGASVVTSRLWMARLALPFLLGLVLILAAWVVVPRASAAPPGVFQPPHSDYGVDTDSDGLFNALVVQVNMSIAQAGDYLISAYLHDAAYRLSTGNAAQAHLDPMRRAPTRSNSSSMGSRSARRGSTAHMSSTSRFT